MKPPLVGRERLWAIAQDAACRAGFDRWLLLAIVCNLALRPLLPWLAYFDIGDEQYLWTFSIGLAGGGAGLLGCWIALGGGRVALRVLIAVVCAWLSVRLHVLGGADEELSAAVHAAVELFALVVAAIVAAALRFARKSMLVQTIYADSASSCSVGPRWQYHLADLFWWVLVASVLLFHRSSLEEYTALFYVFGDSLDGRILYAIRCGAFGCAAMAVLGVIFWLGSRLKFGLLIVLSLSVIGISMLAGMATDFGSMYASLPVFASAGAGALITVYATLLPLRLAGWRLWSGRDIASHN